MQLHPAGSLAKTGTSKWLSLLPCSLPLASYIVSWPGIHNATASLPKSPFKACTQKSHCVFFVKDNPKVKAKLLLVQRVTNSMEPSLIHYFSLNKCVSSLQIQIPRALDFICLE
jgi:hypothetical protein